MARIELQGGLQFREGAGVVYLLGVRPSEEQVNVEIVEVLLFY
jgi:hypothetical protein